MLTQEEYMDVVALRRQGWTIAQIADAVGCHPATVSSWLKRGGPPAKRGAPAGHAPTVSEHWAARVAKLLEANPRAGQLDRTDPPGRGLHRLLPDPGAPPPPGPRGAPSSSTARERAHRDRPGRGVLLRLVRLLRLGGDLGARRPALLRCGALLVTQPALVVLPLLRPGAHLRGPGAFVVAVGGVAAVGRTDRMGALGISRGRVYRFFPEALDFATYHGFALKACKARDAKRKGKTERPFGELNSAFMQEMALDPPGSIAELNTRARRWLDLYVDPRPHRTTNDPERPPRQRGRALGTPSPGPLRHRPQRAPA